MCMARMTAEERFWSRVQWTPGCWLWTGDQWGKGYGRMHANGRNLGAHRFAYELLIGPIPEGLVLDHVVCNTALCVNPAHLEPTTSEANSQRGIRAAVAARTHCKNGHPRTPENTYPRPKGGRNCRPCVAEAMRRHRATRSDRTGDRS